MTKAEVSSLAQCQPMPRPFTRDGVMGDDAMVRFSIAPTHGGAWLWQTVDGAGNVRGRGLAPTRKLAAALVIRNILEARLPQHIPQPSAKAA